MKRLRDSGTLDNLSACSSDLYPSLPAHQPSHTAQYFATIAATMGAMAAGSVTGYSSPAEAIFNEPTTHNSTTWLPMGHMQLSWFVASPCLGAGVGAMAGGMAINLTGRRFTMLASFPIFLLNWILVASAQNFWMLLSGRLVGGVSMGLACTTVPTFIAECASPDIRGALGSTFQVMMMVGVVYPLALGTLVSSWRWLAVLSAIPAVVHFGLVFFIKESPVFLMAKGRLLDMVTSLQYYRGSHFNVEQEVVGMQLDWEEAVRNRESVRDLFKPQHLRPLYITVCLMVLTQISGLMPVISNLSIIFKAAGSSMNPNTSAMLVGVVLVLSTVVAAVLVDRTGRRVLLVLSASIMSLSLVVLGIYFALIDGDEGGGGAEKGSQWVEDHLGWLPLVSLILYFIGFSLGFGPIPWLLMSELFSPTVREAASGLVNMVNWFVSFGITFAYQPLQDSIGATWVFLLLAGLCLLAAIFSAMVVPETKGLTLQQVSALFASTSSDA